MIDGFTLLRPELGWAAIPLLLIAALLIRIQGQRGQWQTQIDPILLPHLLEGAAPRGHRYRSTLIAVTCLLGLIALLGPAWQRQATPLVKSQDALVVVLDLSASMYAQDIQPSRLQQAKYKIRDLLTLRQDGQTGLVASAGDAFVVAPLTDDGNTLLTLLPSLSPAMMPLQGSNPLAGLRQAQQLLEQGAAGRGRILFVGDGIDEKQWPAVSDFAQDSPHSISVLAVGTADGAPIPNREGGFIKDAEGNIAVAKLTREYLQALAEDSGGQYLRLTLDNSDIAPFSDTPATLSGLQQGSGEGGQRRADQWQDGGIWFVLLMLPLALLGFHRAALSVVIAATPAALLISGLALVAPPGYAQASAQDSVTDSGGASWDKLWRTPDQQGAALMDRDPAAAATKFADPMWRGSALYRAGDFSAAAKAFAQNDTATADYNRGNALAQAGQLEEAIAAYDAALEKDPDLEGAARNRDILQQQQEQQKQQKQSQQDGQQGSSDDQSSSESDGNTQNSNDQGDAEKNNQKSSEGNPSQDSQNSDSPTQQSADQDSTNSDSQSSGATPSDKQDSAQQQAQQQSADDYVKQSAQANKGGADTQAQAAQPGEPDDNAQQPTESAVSGRMSEEDQAGEQWLRQIPDSSDQLLRNKFRYQYLQRHNDGDVPDDDDYAPY